MWKMHVQFKAQSWTELKIYVGGWHREFEGIKIAPASSVFMPNIVSNSGSGYVTTLEAPIIEHIKALRDEADRLERQLR